jgi:glycosyltransferase involved in cell wall biosynthesis
MMRVLMLLENDFTNDRRVEKEIRTLTFAGHEVVLAAISSGNLPDVSLWNNSKIYRKPANNFIKKSIVTAPILPFYLNFWRKYINKVLSYEKPFDIVHVHDLPLAKIGIELKRKYNIRLIIDLHENFPAMMELTKDAMHLMGKFMIPVKKWYKYETKSLIAADGLIAVVAEMKIRLVNKGIDPTKIFILENTSFIPDKFPEYRNSLTGRLRLIYIGGINYHRGLQIIIEGLSMISRKDEVELIIAGDGSYLSSIRELSSLRKLTSMVTFTGNLDRKEAEQQLFKSDIALIPHLRSEQTDNSSPNKLYEYMSAGIPVMASNCVSIKRVIDETNCGLSYKYDSPEDFALKVMQILNNRKILKNFSDNGIEAIRNKYNWEKSSSSLCELYSELGK